MKAIVEKIIADVNSKKPGKLTTAAELAATLARRDAAVAAWRKRKGWTRKAGQ